MMYSDEFYNSIRDGSRQSAKAILPLVFDALRPSTVIDVGCGDGQWMSAAETLGAKVVGLEGPWVTAHKSSLDIRVHDLEQPITLQDRFDLALCLEVAEHLPPERARPLVNELCALSDSVLFSAAVPQQIGTNHINCQWQSYWAGLFATNGYVAVDLVRPAVWGRPDVEFWFQQNVILYTKHEIASRLGLVTKRPNELDLAHRKLVLSSLKQLLNQLPTAGLRSVIGRACSTLAKSRILT